jgi:4-amino-4-deoxy-L-arabinose transferase-like glycosyltransferase
MMDVPMLCLITASIYFFIVSEEKNSGWSATLSGICFGLAYLTKQTGALLIPVILIVYLLIRKLNVKALFTRQFGLFLGVALVVLSPWLIFMTYNYGNDFWTAFVYSTFTRASTSIEGHVGGPLYYINYLATNETLVWVILLPIAVGLNTFCAVKRLKADILVVVWITLVLAIFTVSQTKLTYYILPAYPAFALAIASLIYRTYSKLKTRLR